MTKLINVLLGVILIAPLLFIVDEVVTLKHNQPIYEQIDTIKKEHCNILFCKDEAIDEIQELQEQLRVPLRERVL